MTTTTGSARPARAARKPKPEGQWKIDGTEPLNHAEEIKQEEPAFAVKQRVIDIYPSRVFLPLHRMTLPHALSGWAFTPSVSRIWAVN